MRLPPPLRTGQASFPASGSSLHIRPCDGTRFYSRSNLLYSLHDTRLEAAHSTSNPAPVDLAPVPSSVGGCTQAVGLAHLLFLHSRLIKLSRDGRPRGSQLAFAPGIVPVSDRLPAGIGFLRDLVPAPLSARLTACFPKKGGIRAYHVPHTYLNGLGSVCTPVTFVSAIGPKRGPCSWSRTFWSKPSALAAQHPRLVRRFGASTDSSHLLAIPSTRPPSHRCWRLQPPLTVRLLTLEGDLVPEASHRRITPAACSGRVKGQNPRSNPHGPSYVVF